MGKTFCIFSANHLPNIGGIEKFTHNLARELVRRGDHAIIVTNNVYGLATHEPDENGAEVVRLPCRNFMNGRYPLPLKNDEYARELAWLTEQPVDYVIVNTRFYPHSLLGVEFAESKSVRPVVIDHGSAHLVVGQPGLDQSVAVIEHLVTSLVKRHDVDFYGVSAASVEWLRHFGIEGRGVINNSIDADRFVESSSGRDFRGETGVGDDAFVVSFTGRLIPEKGIVQLIEAARYLEDEAGIQFFIAGDGPLRDFVVEAGLSNVHLLGNLGADDVAAMLLQSDVFCLPTRSEGFSTSLLEAAACGAVPVVTNVGGVDELMPENGYGIRLDSAEPENIVAAVQVLYEEPEVVARMSEAIRRRVRDEFSWGRTADRAVAACERAQEVAR